MLGLDKDPTPRKTSLAKEQDSNSLLSKARRLDSEEHISP